MSAQYPPDLTAAEPNAEDVLAAVRRRISTESRSISSYYHGPAHWARVERNGLYLCRFVEADPFVVKLFALVHDSQRRNESIDPGHGPRAAEYAASLRGSILDLDPKRFALLEYACRFHTNGTEPGDVTVSVCWDADRLDIGRVGMPVRSRFLFNEEAVRIARSKDFGALER